MAIFFCGIFLFAFRYKKRKQEYEKENQLLKEQHRLALATAQAEIQQQTMQDIGRELHDHIGQKLTLAAIYTQQLEFEQNANPETGKYARISKVINESLVELRRLSKSLTDTSLEQNMLHELIQRECDRVNALGRCAFAFVSEITSLNTGYNTKVFVMRILQEFIQNSLKHSRCRNILVNARVTAAGLVFQMTDDGEGFNANEQEVSGIGLENMKKRAELLGAEFSLTSTPGTGTELVLVVPVTQMNQ